MSQDNSIYQDTAGTLEVSRWAWLRKVNLTLLLICSVILNVLLAVKVGKLQDSLHTSQLQGQLTIGSSVPPITAKDIAGNEAAIAYTSNDLPTVLYIFKPSCNWCARNLQNIQFLTATVGKEYRVIGLSLDNDKLRDYVAQHNLNFPVYTDLPVAVGSAYKLGGTPQTIVVSNQGKVLKSWMGAYSGKLQQEVDDYFHTRLPGLIEIKGQNKTIPSS